MKMSTKKYKLCVAKNYPLNINNMYPATIVTDWIIFQLYNWVMWSMIILLLCHLGVLPEQLNHLYTHYCHISIIQTKINDLYYPKPKKWQIIVIYIIHLLHRLKLEPLAIFHDKSILLSFEYVECRLIFYKYEVKFKFSVILLA